MISTLSHDRAEQLRSGWRKGAVVSAQTQEERALYQLVHLGHPWAARKLLEERTRSGPPVLDPGEPYGGIWAEIAAHAQDELLRAGFRHEAAMIVKSAGWALPEDWEAYADELAAQGPWPDGPLPRAEVERQLAELKLRGTSVAAIVQRDRQLDAAGDREPGENG